jgi:hypothetical protein
VTKEVTVGPWPEPSADMKRCVASSTDLNQFNFFESNDFSKPPPAASKHSDPGVAFAYFGNPELFDPAAVGTSKWPSDPGEIGTSKCPPRPRRSRDIRVGSRPRRGWDFQTASG